MHTVRSIIVVTLLLGGGALDVAEACSCMSNPPCAAAWRADAVFVATALPAAEEHVGGHLYWIMQKLFVTRTLRGTPGAAVTISPLDRPTEDQITASLAHEKVYAGMNSCAYDFQAGQDYLVYARRTPDGRWTTSMCSGTKRLSEAQADLDYFASLAAAAPTGRVYGSIDRIVLDPDDSTKTRNVAAADITVTLNGLAGRLTATTDAEGKIDLQVPPGDYTVAPVVSETVRVYGGPPTVTLAPRGCAPVSFSLISNGRVEGRVVREDGGGVRGISVGVIPAGTPDGKAPTDFTTAPVGTTDENGRFKIDAILPGRYLLAVNPRSYLSLQSPYPKTFFTGGRAEPMVIEIGDGERKSGFMVAVAPLAETDLSGRIVSGDDQPVAGARLVAYPADARGHIVATGFTDSTGAFRLRLLSGTKYVIQVSTGVAASYRFMEATVFVGGQIDGLKIQFPR